MAEIDARFGRKPGVAEAVGAFQPRNTVGFFQVVRRSGLLHDFQAVADTDHLEISVQGLDGLRETSEIGVFADYETSVRCCRRKLAGTGECMEPVGDLARSGF